MLSTNNLDYSRYKEKYPSNILNISKKDIFTLKDNINDPMSCNNPQNSSEFAVYDGENYTKQLREYQKLQQNVENVSIDEYNKIFTVSKNKIEKEIIDLEGQVNITRDPYISEYTDTYSTTPYATYMLTPLSGSNIETEVSRFDDCFGIWNNGYFDDMFFANYQCYQQFP